MHNLAAIIAAGAISALFIGTQVRAEETPSTERRSAQPQSHFEPFTGKILREKVRLRLQPNLESPVIKELTKNDLLIITGEVDDFYAVQPPSSIKGYVYRPYVLDGVIEGTRVNVRLGPHLEAPIIAQLNSGDKIDGAQSSENIKWLEITPPSWTRFYVASDYIEKVGDINYLSSQQTRRQEAITLLNDTYLFGQNELQKPFTEINIEKVLSNYRTVMEGYKDFPEQVTHAKEYLSKFQDEYLHRKIAYLESKTRASMQEREQILRNTSERLARESGEIPSQNILETYASPQSPEEEYRNWIANRAGNEVTSKMVAWASAELSYYQNWAENHENQSVQNFYDDQKKDSIVLKGMIEAYDRPIRNKPGDYILINKSTNLTIAYLYSTHVNLQDKLGQEVTIEGGLRPNKNFAYPAYFVLAVE